MLNKLQIYNSIVKNLLTYEAETWKFNKNLESKLRSMELIFFIENVKIMNKRRKATSNNFWMASAGRRRKRRMQEWIDRENY